jgi:hypothetical protein
VAATDPRNFVKKAVSMALRAVGKRNLVLNGAALAVAERLAASKDPTARWVGKHAKGSSLAALRLTRWRRGATLSSHSKDSRLRRYAPCRLRALKEREKERLYVLWR